MSDKFYRISIERLFNWILTEESEGRIFGIYKENIFVPTQNDPFKLRRYGQLLETPIGVAAGPHTQMAQNIVAAWLTGSRYIELKTIQTLDELDVTKPCIDMEDEGYNCEWSQELKIKDSFDEYLNAWILIHILKHKFGWNQNELGVIFNMSVGYNLEGILKSNVQWYFDKMNDCSIELNEKIARLEILYPQIREINIPSTISNNITLSTMHGCPADEIESIGKYLIEERKLHTTIKLNPTLLGPKKLRYILNDKLGYKTIVPDEAFEHDLKFDDAVEMIKSLQQSANNVGVDFSVKLTNTLESINTTNWLPEKEKMVYTSGRALHPISVNVAKKLQEYFDGNLDISFSAGIDAFNIADTLACNMKPITICSDLLKPGGYIRSLQYLEELKKSFNKVDANSIESFILKKSGVKDIISAGLLNLSNYTAEVIENNIYKKQNFHYENIKTQRNLAEYDCIKAPCSETCAVSQDVSEYMWHTSNGNFEKALDVILKDNPLPNITGNVCDHLCQTKCTRMNYDNTLLIRGIKRFNSESTFVDINSAMKGKNGFSVAIIGAGPSGLSSAYFLALEGFTVNVYESKPFAGGMASDSIPSFRLTNQQIEADVDLIKTLGVNFHFNQNVNSKLFNKITSNNNFVHIAIGAQGSKLLGIEGENLVGVFDQLSFLSKVRRNEEINIGKNVAIVGGGNSAVDAARTANRLVGINGKVTVLYRRTIHEMPADSEEIEALLNEGIELYELTAPVNIVANENKLDFHLIKMKLGEADESGRRKPIKISNSEFSLTFDSIIPAIGQEVKLDFLENESLDVNKDTFETNYTNIYAGGDAIRGADSLINAIGDGKKVAQEIIKKIGTRNYVKTEKSIKPSYSEFQMKQSRRIFGKSMPEISLGDRNNFELVHPSLSKDDAIEEASRCLLCDDVCNICVGVCPNLANISFKSTPGKIPVYKIAKRDGELVCLVNHYFQINQKLQIINIGDFCNECGNCNTFCPTNDAPYLTKPKFYLTKESFDAEDNCFYLTSNEILYKNSGKNHLLRKDSDKYVYISDSVEIEFELDNYVVINYNILVENSSEIVLEKAAEMIFLLKQLNNKMMFN